MEFESWLGQRLKHLVTIQVAIVHGMECAISGGAMGSYGWDCFSIPSSSRPWGAVRTTGQRGTESEGMRWKRQRNAMGQRNGLDRETAERYFSGSRARLEHGLF